jgi:hypothetical protein
MAAAATEKPMLTETTAYSGATYILPISASNLHDMEYIAAIRRLRSASRRSQSAKNYQSYQAEIEAPKRRGSTKRL